MAQKPVQIKVSTIFENYIRSAKIYLLNYIDLGYEIFDSIHIRLLKVYKADFNQVDRNNSVSQQMFTYYSMYQ